jgi:chromosome segregation ATPase
MNPIAALFKRADASSAELKQALEETEKELAEASALLRSSEQSRTGLLAFGSEKEIAAIEAEIDITHRKVIRLEARVDLLKPRIDEAKLSEREKVIDEIARNADAQNRQLRDLYVRADDLAAKLASTVAEIDASNRSFLELKAALLEGKRKLPPDIFVMLANHVGRDPAVFPRFAMGSLQIPSYLPPHPNGPPLKQMRELKLD